MIFTSHACSCNLESFRLVPFHACRGNAGIDEARDSPVGEGNATLIDANHNRRRTARADVCVHGGRRLMYLISNKFVRQIMFFHDLLTINKVWPQMRHQWSLVIGLLTPCLSSDLCACPYNVTAVVYNTAVPAFFLQEMFLNISEIDCICERGSGLFHPLILVHTECVPLNGKGDPPTADWCLPDRWDVYWGPQVRGMGWGGARGRILLVESVSDSTLSLSPPHPTPLPLLSEHC